VWLETGHTVDGLDISRELVELARSRNAPFADKSSFTVGTATRLPWADEAYDVCLLPELLEHVEDWESCVLEAVRVLRPGGTILLSTTNVLCPIQQEFTLPCYSWYPAWLKQRVVRRAMSDSPQLANYASYPAVNWFSVYGLSRYLAKLSVKSSDRFDLVDLAGRGSLAAAMIGIIRAFPPARFVAHVLTEGTAIVGEKQAGVAR
jgi:2-polyprenyl-6-hydroxyphenyl methylase/3-demethylubiquinone-9 3-methyltransferase